MARGRSRCVEQRRKARFQARHALPIRLLSGRQWRKGRMHNLSEGGAFVTVETDVWVGQEVKLELAFPKASPKEHILLRALTVWRMKNEELTDSETGRGYGLHFLDEKDVGPIVSQEISHLVDAGILEPMKTAGLT